MANLSAVSNDCFGSTKAEWGEREAERQTEVRAALSTLHNTVRLLAAEIDVLVERLAPVLVLDEERQKKRAACTAGFSRAAGD